MGFLAKRGKNWKKGLKKKGLHWVWKKCADEGGRCKVFANAPDTTGFRSEGETMVRFGAKGVFTYLDVKGSTACTQKSFGGNPLPKHMRKSKIACYFKQQVGPKVDEHGCRPDQTVINRVVDKDHPYGHDCVQKTPIKKKKPKKKKVKRVLQKKKAVKPGK